MVGHLKYIFLFFSSLFIFADPYIPEYVWNLGFAIAADQSPFKDGLPENYGTISHAFFVEPKKYIRNGKDGDIIWVQSVQIGRFCKEILPYLKYRFVLIVNDGDESFSFNQQDCRRLVEDSRLIAVFSQNVADTFCHPKIHHLPIGIDFHSIARENGFFGEQQYSVIEQELILSDILSGLLPTNQRKKRVAIDFGYNDFRGFGESRTDIIKKLLSLPFIDHLPGMPRHASWLEKGEYAFAVSPHGFGLDCHRTWEGLTLGNIVIVKTSSLDRMYEGLPVVIVNDWSEITEENLDLWLEKYGDAFTHPSYREKITHTYWMNKIRKIVESK